MLDFIYAVVSFFLLSLAALHVGNAFSYLRLPVISGFLLTGILVGPFVLGFIDHDVVERLHFIDQVALAFIAFSAGSQLFLKELRSRLKSIFSVTFFLVIFTLGLSALAIFLLSSQVSFLAHFDNSAKIGIALLAGTVLVTRSPSVAIAIINELRAKGPFTQTVLGVTVIMDVVVISLFAINSSLAKSLIAASAVNLGFLVELSLELGLSFLLGYLLYLALTFLLSTKLRKRFKIIPILLLGYACFVFADGLAHISHQRFHTEFHLEPLLICMLAGFLTTNYSPYKAEFGHILSKSSIPIYLAFFTITGASIELNVLSVTWPITIALFATRLLGGFLGSFLGGALVGEPTQHNRIRWMGFVTQAGVGLGLASEIAGTFPDWGSSLATIIISVIVINEIVGPLFFKWAITIVGESHVKAPHEFDGVRDALIFGLERQSFVLARQLKAHNWQVKIVALEHRNGNDIANSADIDIVYIKDLEPDSLESINMRRADAIISMLTSDEQSYQLCERVYENYGIETMVVRLNDRANIKPFQDLGVLIVDPSTATVQLLEEFVRSPYATSLLLGMNESQDIVDIELRERNLHGVLLRDLRLPLDALVLSIKRGERVFVTHGYTRLQLGDRVTVVGSPESIEKLVVDFGEG